MIELNIVVVFVIEVVYQYYVWVVNIQRKMCVDDQYVIVQFVG